MFLKNNPKNNLQHVKYAYLCAIINNQGGRTPTKHSQMDYIFVTVKNRKDGSNAKVIKAAEAVVSRLGILIKDSPTLSWDDDEGIQFYAADCYTIRITATEPKQN